MKQHEVSAEVWKRAQIVSIYDTNVKVIFLDKPLQDPDTLDEIKVVTFDHNDPDVLPMKEGRPGPGNLCWVRDFRKNPQGWRAHKARFVRPVEYK